MSKKKPVFNIPIKSIYEDTNEKDYMVDITTKIDYNDLSFHKKNNINNSSNINKPIFYIDIQKIIDEDEKYIQKKIEAIKHEPNLSYYQKRMKILLEEKTIPFENEEIINEKNKNENKENILKKGCYPISEDKTIILNIGDTNQNICEKNNKPKNTSDNVYNINNNNNNNNIIINNKEKISDKIDLRELKKYYLNKSEIVYYSYLNKPENIHNLKKFNSARANFYLKYNLYDIPLDIKDLTIHAADKFIINEKYFAFCYPNDLNTYYITESGFLLNHEANHKDENYLKDINENKNNFYEKFGLYFCGENVSIQIGNNINKKKCSPNQFMCKECMEINKKKYCISNKYLININGRVAKINKGKIHCFGHFLNKNRIEDCISKFTCKACNMLDLYSNYYYSSKTN